MKKHQISELVSRFATPVVLLVLGLVLIFCPDTASALISKVVGWGLLMAGIIVAVAMVVDSDWSVSKVLTVLALVILGRWLMTQPLAWAACTVKPVVRAAHSPPNSQVTLATTPAAAAASARPWPMNA